jgi:hypothetical protein
MNRTGDVDQAIRVAVAPLTPEEERAFSDELQARLDELTVDPACIDAAWRIAFDKLFADPRDPVGEAWSRLAGALRELDALR